MFHRDRDTVRQLLRLIENQQRIIDQLLAQQSTRPEPIPQLHRPPDALEEAWTANPEQEPVY